MALYALVNDSDQVVDTKNDSRIDLNAGTRTGWRWLPVNNIINDISTGPDTVMESAVEAVLASEVTRTRTKRDMTAQEISDRDDAQIAGMDNVQNAVIFEIVKRVRVLQQEAGITNTQMNALMAADGFTKAKLAAFIKANL